MPLIPAPQEAGGSSCVQGQVPGFRVQTPKLHRKTPSQKTKNK